MLTQKCIKTSKVFFLASTRDRNGGGGETTTDIFFPDKHPVKVGTSSSVMALITSRHLIGNAHAQT